MKSMLDLTQNRYSSQWRADNATGEDKYQQIKKIVDSSSMGKIDGTTVDLQTANMLKKIADSLNSENRAKFLNMPISKMVSVGWKLVK